MARLFVSLRGATTPHREFSRPNALYRCAKNNNRLTQTQTDTLTATILPEPLRVSYRELTTLRFVESRVLPVVPIAEAFARVLRGLRELVELDVVHHADKCSLVRLFENDSRRNESAGRIAKYLAQRSSTAAQLLSDTLAFKDQEIAQEQSKTMLELTKSTVFLTRLGLFYMPWSLFAVREGHSSLSVKSDESQSLFSTSFFSIREGGRGGWQWGLSPLIWIYVLCSTILMMLTIAMYHCLARRNGIQKTFVPKAEKVNSGAANLSGMAWIPMIKTLTGVARRATTVGKEVV